jgi:WD40 repeat protein
VGTGTLPQAERTVHLLVLDPDHGTVAWSKPDPGGPGDASALALSPDGRLAAVGFQSGAVSVWDLAARELLATVRDHTDVVRAVAIAPDGRHVASASRQGHLVVRRLGSEQPVLTWRGESTFYSAAFVDEHTLVTTGFLAGRLRWWWWEPERLRAVLDGLSLPALSPMQQQDLDRLIGR